MAVPRSPEEVVEQKFQAGAALKAERAAAAWRMTETHWADETFGIGPFEIGYTYQRADLAIHGPPVYETRASQAVVWSGYTSCGMSALASLMLALGRGSQRTLLMMRPDCYPETRELVAGYGVRFGLTPVLTDDPVATRCHRDEGAVRVLLLDSGVPTQFAASEMATGALADLVIFDTTCLAATSCRIGAVLRRNADAGLPTVMARSHTKLDSLGIEYGRLGSVTVALPPSAPPRRRDLAVRLARELQDAVRLLGAAAVPSHLPPFIGGPEWRRLYRGRIARIIRNNRRAAARLAALIGDRCRVTCFQHGLFLTITPPQVWDETHSREMARSLAHAMRARGLPVRPAGSFGFDFAVVDAFPAREDGRHCLRLAIADLPDAPVDKIVAATAAWDGFLPAPAYSFAVS